MTSAWSIWYMDGTIFRSGDGLPETAPTDGIQCVVQTRADGVPEIIAGQDYYFWIDDYWAYGSLVDLQTYIRNHVRQVKIGAWTSKQNFRDVYNRALAEMSAVDRQRVVEV